MIDAVIMTLEGAQEREVAPLLRRAYNEGGAVFAEIRRDLRQGGAATLILGVLDAKTAKRIRRVLATR